MNEPGISTGDSNLVCKICNERPRRYTCPQCGIDYCSLHCYKSEGHQDCSEAFYEDWVKMEMQLRNYNPENKKKMLEILERFKRESEEPSIVEDILNREDEDSMELDSDDDEDVPSLEQRLANIDLDNADELWSVLTDGERQEFEAILQSNDIEKILPEWMPWWEQTVERKLVQELNEVPHYEKLCPALVTIAEFKGEMKVSPCVQFNLMNVIYSYAYIALHFFGDHLNSAKLATQVFLYVCDNMNQKKVFTDANSAVNAVFQQIFGESDLTESEEGGRMLSIKQAGNQIIRGPDEENCCYYVTAALSDLLALLSRAKMEICSKSASTKARFPRKFQEHKDLQNLDISKKTIQLHLKKLEFYLAWVNLHGKKLCGSKLNLQEPKLKLT